MFERSIAISVFGWAVVATHTSRWYQMADVLAARGIAGDCGRGDFHCHLFPVDYMIRFEILHLILVMSLLSLPLMSLHWTAPLACAVVLESYFTGGWTCSGSVWWMWIIWTNETAGSVDYRPIIHWGFAFFVGMAARPFKPSKCLCLSWTRMGLDASVCVCGTSQLGDLSDPSIMFAGFNIYGFFVV